MRRFFTMLATLLVGGSAAFGQFTNVLENSTTQVVASVWNIGSTNLWVGDQTSSNEMSIISGGSVVNGDGFVGAQAGASSNTVNVSGSGSWENTGTLQVGAIGNVSNQVSVFDEGTVTASNLVIHAENDFNLNNDGTLVMTGDFDAGQAGFNWNDGSTLTVNQTLTLNTDLGGTNKTLNIDGGSWDRGGDLWVDGFQNTLAITNGGGVTSINGFVGSTIGSSSNVVSVSGDGSHWINNGTLTVGNSNSNTANSVAVDSGGLVQADGLSIDIDDTFNLNNGGTLAMTGGFDASMDGFNWDAGGTLSMGGTLTGLVTATEGTILSGEKKLVLNGGSLATSTNLIVGYESSNNTLAITNGGTVDSADGYIGWGATATNNSVLVSGTNSVWGNNGNLYVGVYETNLLTAGAGNSLTVSNNAWVFVGDDATNLTVKSSGGIGVAGDSEMVVGSNAAVVAEQGIYVGTATSTGTVSVLNGGSVTANALEIDVAGTFNLDGTLTMTGDLDAGQTGFNWNDGSTLTMNQTLTLNDDLGGSNKTLNIDGGSWDRGGDLRIDGYQTSLVITNSGTVDSVNGVIGSTVNDWKNSVVVSGTNSVWVNSANLTVGFQGSDNKLTISNAGRVESVDGHIGSESSSSGNTVVVDGGVWSNSGDLTVGDSGSGNKLIIENGGLLNSVMGYVGRAVGSSNNTVLVTGDGSDWINTGNLVLGNSSSNTANSVTVEDGGWVTANDLSIGVDDVFNLNNDGTLEITSDFDVTLEGFNWNDSGKLSVGGLLEGMNVATNLPIGDAVYLGNGKDQTLDGGQWLNGDTNLIVGLNDDFSNLILSNGGTVDNADGYIGWGSVADNNSVLVQADSAWTSHGGGLYVGKWFDANTNLVDAGQGNSLTVEDGGWVFVGEGRTNGPSGGLVVASANGAELVVGGNGSLVEVEQGLYVGVNAVSTGTVSVANGGIVSVGELVVATNSTFDLFGTLEVASDFDVNQSGDFIWNDGGTLSMGGTLTGLDALDGTNRILEITEEGSWTTVTNLITGTGNNLLITDGGQVTNQTAFIGVSINDWDNTVLVSGTGSVWTLTDDLWVNSSNTLELASTGLVSIDGNMTVSNATVDGSGRVEFGAGTNVLSVTGTNSAIESDVVFDGGDGEDTVAITDNKISIVGTLTNRFVGFENLNMTNSLLTGTGTVDGFTNVDMAGGWITPVGELTVEGVFVANGTVLQVNVGVETNLLHLTSGLDLSTMGAEVVVLDGLNPTNLSQTILVSDGGLTNAFDASISDITEHYLLYDFEFDSSSGTTVDVVSVSAQDGEISATLAYGGVQGVRAGFNGMQNALFVRTKQLRRNTVATDHAISNEAYLMSSTNAPSGPQGPGDRNTIFGMHFWAEQFSGQGDYDAQGVSDGFSLNNNGTTFGFDRLFGDSLVAGINYTYARSAALESGGDRVDTETYWLGLYGEWSGKNDYYLEGLIGLGWTDYETTRIDGGYAGEGKFEGSDFGGHLEAGKYFHRNNWAMAPYAGLQYLSIKSDAYTEKSVNPIEVDGQNIASLESAFGVKLRNRFDTQAGRFQTVGYAEWTYDFINDDIGSTLSDGTISVATARVAPGASLLNGGIGLSWICTDYLEIGVGYDGRFNEDYEEHTGSIMLDVRF